MMLTMPARSAACLRIFDRPTTDRADTPPRPGALARTDDLRCGEADRADTTRRRMPA